MPFKDPERQRAAVREWRKEHTGWDRDHRPDRRARYPSHEGRFVGVDGEGWGKTYSLLADSGGKDPLIRPEGISTAEAFDWLSYLRDRNGKSVFVGFALSYDINHWVRDLPTPALYRLWRSGRVRWEGWWMEWAPGKWFHLKRLDTGASVRIWDIFPFFQTSFLTACENWGVPVPAEVIEGKGARHSFGPSNLAKIQSYNDLELQTLVALARALKVGMADAGIDLNQWYGAGAAASRLFQLAGVKRTVYDTPAEMLPAVMASYFAGRIEAGRLGRIPGPIYNYDLNSAYPYAMSVLPNMARGRWVRSTDLSNDFAVFRVEWNWSKRKSGYYPLPWRDSGGAIYFPPVGKGWYWQPELRAAIETGFPLEITDGWAFEPTDAEDLRPFAWVRDRYESRLKAGKKSGAGRAIKLALAALYGKQTQREGHYGRPTYRQYEYGGWVTSYVRSRVWKLAANDLDSIVSFNTDGIFTDRPLGVDNGALEGRTETFGAFDRTVFREIEIVMPGVYRLLNVEGEWENFGRGFGKLGVPWDRVERAWAHGTKTISTSVDRFHGLGECLHGQSPKLWLDRNRWRSWAPVTKQIRIREPSLKRIGARPYDPQFGVPSESSPYVPRVTNEERESRTEELSLT